jgi:hypothetical protein
VAASRDVRIVAISNPIIPGGPFYEAFTSDRDRWKTIKISGFDTLCVAKDSVCSKSRGLIAKNFACIAKGVAHKMVFQNTAVLYGPAANPDRSEEFFKVEWTRRRLVHVRQTEAVR